MASNSEHPSSVLTRFEVNQAGAAETNAAMASIASKAATPSSSANAASAASAAASVTSYHHSRQTSLPASMNIQQQVGNVNSNHVHFQNDLILRHQHQRVTQQQHQQMSDHHQNLSKQKFSDLDHKFTISM